MYTHNGQAPLLCFFAKTRSSELVRTDIPNVHVLLNHHSFGGRSTTKPDGYVV